MDIKQALKNKDILMQPREIKSAKDAETIIKKRQLQHIKIAITDLNGILRSKYLSTEKFLSALKKGFGFCDVILGGDCDDSLCDNMKMFGWHKGYPDAPVHIIPSSCREIPFEPNTLLFLCEFAPPTDMICPRQLLKRVIKKAESMGLYPYCGFEYEFTVFNETCETIREKNYKNLRTITPGNFGYSMMRNSLLSDFYHEVLSLCSQMDMNIEGMHTEIGPGVLECALTADEALSSADKAVLFKTMIKILTERRGWTTTFMAKWNKQLQGQGGHFHLSLLNSSGNNLFFDEKDEHGMSTTMKEFLAGQQQLMPEWLAMVAPNINSFARLVPDFWAPTQALWGIDNRTVALRVIPGSVKSQRIEYRAGAADANAYLLAAAAIASGLYGIENHLSPTDPIVGNGYQQPHKDSLKFPGTLEEATDLFIESKPAIEYFGKEFVEDYAATRYWETREYRKAITDWQLERYFEIT